MHLVQVRAYLGLVRISLRGHGPMEAFLSRTAPSLRCLGLIIAAAVVEPGCGVSSPSWNSVQVWGRVTYKGEPVKAGALIFEPGPTTRSNWGVASISEEGKYKLASNEPDLNLVPGRFVIFLRPPSPPVERKHGRFDDHNESDEKAIAIASSYPVPKRFLNADTSELWVDLEKEPTRVDIDLKD
jgi:hypothetical protein